MLWNILCSRINMLKKWVKQAAMQDWATQNSCWRNICPEMSAFNSLTERHSQCPYQAEHRMTNYEQLWKRRLIRQQQVKADVGQYSSFPLNARLTCTVDASGLSSVNCYWTFWAFASHSPHYRPVILNRPSINCLTSRWSYILQTTTTACAVYVHPM